MSQQMRGVFAIPSTPFDERGQVDHQDLRRIVDFCIGCGAHGLVYPVNASGFTTLSDEERMRASQVVVEQAAARVPVVVGAAGVCAEQAAMFSQHAESIGADAVIAMAPYVRKITDEEGIVAYYRAIWDVIGIPIFIQNHGVGTVLPVPTMARLVREVEHIEHIKEETFPITHKLSQLLDMVGPKLKGVFGGAGGR